MTQEEKDLLLKDLCARLPYGVKIEEQYGDIIDVNLYNAHLEHLIDRISLGLDKLVLRPMSSMTEEELQELNEVFYNCNTEYRVEAQDWLNAHHFDYRGLIERGLALEAPEGMYKMEE